MAQNPKELERPAVVRKVSWIAKPMDARVDLSDKEAVYWAQERRLKNRDDGSMGRSDDRPGPHVAQELLQ